MKVRNLASAGLNSDFMPFGLPADHTTELSNVRISNGSLSPFGGSTKVADLPIDFKPGYLMSVGNSENVFWIIAGLDSVIVYDGTSTTSISSTAGYVNVTSEDKWTGCNVADVPILTNPNHFPEYWPSQSAATKLIPLPWDSNLDWAGANQSCRIIRSHKQFLFALDLVINGVEVPNGVRWSNPADIGGVPTTWDELDTTDIAGLTSLKSEGGRVVDGLSLRDSFVVYRERGIAIFDYVGGVFVWQIRQMSSSAGLISPDSIVEVRGLHYFIGDGDILVNDGNKVKSLLHNRIRKHFTSNFDPGNYKNSFAVRNDIAGEVWFCIPKTGSVYPNIAYIYNWLDDSWSIRDLPETPFANYGSRSSVIQTWDSVTNNWGDSVSNWSASNASPLDYTVMSITKPAGVGQSGSLLQLDYGLSGLGDSPFNTMIERTGFVIDGLDGVTTVTRVYPYVKGFGEIYIQFGSQDFPDSAIRWKDAVKFTPGVDRKVDLRTTGELHCYRFFSNNNSSYWELSGFDLEYVSAGSR
tara:strand:+ start:3780 stop:5351 length:1572 start_codon:yes stop_codon:yes gene_type:complete